MTKRQAQADFTRWWVETAKRRLPKNRATLLAELRRISDLQSQLSMFKEMYKQDEDCMIQFEHMQEAWLAARDVE